MLHLNKYASVVAERNAQKTVRFHEVVEPVVIEGADILHTLCPVNPLTGHPSSVLSILHHVTDGNKALVDKILQDLPAVQQADVPDDVKIDMLAGVDVGTFAEKDAFLSRLTDVASVLLPSNNEVKETKETINFTSNDNPEASSEQ